MESKQFSHLVSLLPERTIPVQVEYLGKYELMKDYLDNLFQMPDKPVTLLVRFLEQGNGRLSVRAKARKFKELTDEEVDTIENKYQEIF